MVFEKKSVDVLQMQYRLEHGFLYLHKQFTPEALIMSVEEPEFGCEGRPEDQEVYGVLHGMTVKGPVSWKLEEHLLDESLICDRCWVGYLPMDDGTRSLIVMKEDIPKFEILREEIWNARIPLDAD